MTPQNKLQAAFNKHAEKIINQLEFKTLFIKLLETRFSAADIQKILNKLHQPLDTATCDALRQKAQDGTLGVYRGGFGDVCMRVSALTILTNFSQIEASQQAEVFGAFAEAVEKATDFKKGVKNGSLRPVEPKI